jgi:hypothetical protein
VVIATEGNKTEPTYFKLNVFKNPEISVNIKILPSKGHSSPIGVKKRMDKYIKDYDKKENDQFWLVVDKDKWEESDLDVLYSWTSVEDNKFIAVSNPHFEYWLLLHFEDGNDVHNKTECLKKLKCHCPKYDKNNIPADRFTENNVKDAAKRAKLKDTPPCTKWPTRTGTTVYRLVEHIIR